MLPGVSVLGVSGGFASVNPGQIFGGQLPAPFDPSKSLVLAMAPEKQQPMDPRLGRIKHARRADVGTLDDDDDHFMGLLQVQSEHRTLSNAVAQLTAQIQPFTAVVQQLQPLAQAAPALVSIAQEWQPLVGHVSRHESEIQRLDSQVKEIHTMLEERDVRGPALGGGDEASLYAENRGEIQVSAKKLELTVSTGMAQTAAEEEIKKAIATTGKTLDDLKGKFSGEDFYTDESFTKVVVAFDSVAIRKMAQAAVCANLVDGKWKESNLKLGSGEEIRVRVQQPPYARRRDARLRNARSALMAKNRASDYNEFPIVWNERAISKRDGTIMMKQQKFGAWVVKDVP